ncbi:hypothetical protein D3C71_1288090 [compost metagenome]
MPERAGDCAVRQSPPRWFQMHPLTGRAGRRRADRRRWSATLGNSLVPPRRHDRSAPFFAVAGLPRAAAQDRAGRPGTLRARLDPALDPGPAGDRLAGQRGGGAGDPALGQRTAGGGGALRRPHRPVRWRGGRPRRAGAQPGADEQAAGVRPGGSHPDRTGRYGAGGGAQRGAGARADLSGGFRRARLLLDRRQHRHQRRRHPRDPLRQHPRVDCRVEGGHRQRRAAGAQQGPDQEFQRLRLPPVVDRLRRHARGDRRGDAAAHRSAAGQQCDAAGTAQLRSADAGVCRVPGADAAAGLRVLHRPRAGARARAWRAGAVRAGAPVLRGHRIRSGR